MNYKQYSPQLWNAIEEAIDAELKSNPHPVAAFDADGTLWDMDLGENFFQHQIDHKLVPLPESPFDHYVDLKLKNNDPREAYVWLAAINKGVPLAQVQQWCHEAVKEAEPIPVFSEQQKLIQLLQKKGVEVYVVTASVKWAVEPGAERFYQIPNKYVLGIETHINEGFVTERSAGIVTYRQGKVDALLEATKGRKPFLCSGNTMGDFELLKSATRVALAVSAANQDDKLYKTEKELQENAAELGWLSHRFI